MHDTKLVQVLNTKCDLISEVLSAALSKRETTSLQILKQVFALHVVKNDVMHLAILEQVYQPDDIVVLTHFEYFDLSALLEDLNRLHVLFLDSLDGHFLACKLVCCQLNQSKLAFAKRLSKLVVVKNI